jgi:hypothetical protein
MTFFRSFGAPVVASFLGAACAITACSHDHDEGETHTSTYPSCAAVLDACHPLDEGTGLVHDCHNLAHDGTEETCAPRKAECLAACVPKVDAGGDAGPRDATSGG